MLREAQRMPQEVYIWFWTAQVHWHDINTNKFLSNPQCILTLASMIFPIDGKPFQFLEIKGPRLTWMYIYFCYLFIAWAGLSWAGDGAQLVLNGFRMILLITYLSAHGHPHEQCSLTPDHRGAAAAHVALLIIQCTREVLSYKICFLKRARKTLAYLNGIKRLYIHTYIYMYRRTYQSYLKVDRKYICMYINNRNSFFSVSQLI